MSEVTRRDFVKKGAGAALAASTVFSIQPHTVLGANEKVNVAGIGVKSQGFSVISSMQRTGKANIVTLCDVDENVAGDKAHELEEKYKAKRPQLTGDFRKVLEDKEIDAVVIGTPDHWHGIMAIDACAAGKDVYVEKPCALTITECRDIAKAAKKHDRIMQHGTMQRSGKHFQEAREYVQSGKLGKIALSRAWAVLGRTSIGHKADSKAPEGVDYDMWLGPAPKRAFNENRFHYNWRFFWDYGTGDMGNWGVHWIDISLWGLDLGFPETISSTAGKFVFDDDKEVPDTQITTYGYKDVTVQWELRMWSKHPIEGRGTGTAFYGSDGTLVVDRGGWQVYEPDGKTLVAENKSHNNSLLDHAHDFLDCVKSRKSPIADIANGHISAAVANFGNVAYFADEKLRYNPQTNTVDKKEHNPLLTREYHNGWALPVV